MLIPMKKATLYALKNEREAILLALQKLGEFMPIAREADSGLDGREGAAEEAARTGAALKFISSHQQNKKFFEPRLPVSLSEFCVEDHAAQELAGRAENAQECLTQLKTEIFSLKAQAGQLIPWRDLDIPLDKLIGTKSTVFLAGFMPEEDAQRLDEDLECFVASVELFGICPDGQAVLVVSHVADAKEVAALLKEKGFTEALFPCCELPAGELSDKLLQEAGERAVESRGLQEQIEQLALEKETLQKFYDKKNTDAQRLAVRGEETAETFCMSGWVRFDRESEVENAVASVTDAYELSFRDPVEGEEPPSMTVNQKIIEPYQAITNLYSRPLPTGIDPNPLMAPFYFIFFGMMLSDAGYGLVVTVLLIAVNKFLKPRSVTGQLVNVVLMGAISTVFWGAMFGGWFGVELKPLMFSPMNEPLKMLILCYALGAVHLVVGMATKMYMEIKRGNLFGAIVDQLSWLILLAGLVLYVLLPNHVVGRYMSLVGMLTILLCAGRINRGLIRKLLGGMTSLYNITGYLSDILSYSRLFALGLATGVIGMVINTIAGMLWKAGIAGQIAALVVLVGGHTFNIAVNVLGAYVHTSRLQFIEFFGKFYEPGGQEFKPLAFRTKYVDIAK